MSDEQKHEVKHAIEQLETLQEKEIDLDITIEEIGLEDLSDGQGLTETGASVKFTGCCSCLGTKS